MQCLRSISVTNISAQAYYSLVNIVMFLVPGLLMTLCYSLIVTKLYCRYCPAGTVLQVWSCRYSTADTVLNVWSCRYCPAGTVLQVWSCRYCPAGIVLQVLS